MNWEFLAYPFIFIGLYFEVFMLLTLLSTPAKERRARPATTKSPKVAIIVPCYNEETTVGGTVESLLALDYPKEKLEIVLVNDGSTDGTKDAMDAYQGNPQITIVHKENGGKHTAINLGIEIAKDAEFVGCLDADSFVAPDALREMIACFDNPRVMAATPAMSVFEPKSILEAMQNAEYILGIAFRHALSAVNGIYVTPGPFSFYRRSVIEELGGFRHAHQAEDMEMALRIQKAGYEIENAPRARVYTKVPRTVPLLIKQRTRWTSGFLRNVTNEYRDLLGNPKYGVLGLLVLPLGLVAVTGCITLFGLAIFIAVSDVIETYLTYRGIPLDYMFRLPEFSADTLYAMVSFVTVISLVVLAVSVTFMYVGKRISETPGKLSLGVIGYAFVYGLIAPFWVLRSLTDLLTGTRRPWR